MFEQAITKTTQSTLALLGKEKILKKAYLAGGTALALQIGHRLSYDLDFFTDKSFNRKEIIRRLLPLRFKLEREDWRTILGGFKDVKFSIFYYDYPLIAETQNYLGVDVADLKDVAAMKIEAISARGKKRDFIDLYFLAQKFGLGNLLKFYDQKYKLLRSNRAHILKSIDYFTDAEIDKEPKMLAKGYSWQKVKDFLREEVKKLI